MISPEQLEQIYRTLRSIQTRVAEDAEGGEQALTHGSLYVRDVSDLLAEVDRLSTLQKEREWIPVSERLPEVAGIYLAGCAGSIEVLTLHYYAGEWWLRGVRFDTVTHWQPLPKPPEGEQNG